MTPIKQYVELRGRRDEAMAEIKGLNAAIAALGEEIAKLEDQMFDLENFELTDADLAYISKCDAEGVEPLRIPGK